MAAALSVEREFNLRLLLLLVGYSGEIVNIWEFISTVYYTQMR